MTAYRGYDRFAWVYNKHWSDFSSLALPILNDLLLKHLPAGARILDLCCGTGQLAQALIAQGYQVTGLDGSEEMIRLAHKNAPDGDFLVADARLFQLKNIYHAVVSTFDSLNHVMSMDELTAVFHNVYSALINGAWFSFDLNMEEGYELCWNDSFGIVEEDHVCVVRASYCPEEKKAKFEATVFRLLEGEWKRSDITLLQRCYSEAEVRSALRTVGFIDIEAYAYGDQCSLTHLTPETERAFFVCRKPASGGRKPLGAT